MTIRTEGFALRVELLRPRRRTETTGIQHLEQLGEAVLKILYTILVRAWFCMPWPQSGVGRSAAVHDASYHPMRDRMATDRSIFGITVYVEENDAQRLNYYGFAADLWPGHTLEGLKQCWSSPSYLFCWDCWYSPRHLLNHSQNFTLFGAPRAREDHNVALAIVIASVRWYSNHHSRCHTRLMIHLDNLEGGSTRFVRER